MKYPSVIVEVAYLQKKWLARLAEDYLLDLDANIYAASSLNNKYGKKGLREATLLAWRTKLFTIGEGGKLRVTQ